MNSCLVFNQFEQKKSFKLEDFRGSDNSPKYCSMGRKHILQKSR